MICDRPMKFDERIINEDIKKGDFVRGKTNITVSEIIDIDENNRYVLKHYNFDVLDKLTFSELKEKYYKVV